MSLGGSGTFGENDVAAAYTHWLVPMFFLRSRPARVDEIVMSGTHVGIVGCEEQRHRSYIGRHDSRFEALIFNNPGRFFRVMPERILPRCFDAAGHDRINTDIISAEVAGQRAGHPLNACLRRLVKDHIWRGEVPTDRSEVQDNSAASPYHHGNHSLRREEQVAQVHTNTIIPILRCDVGNDMAVVIGGIIDQHVDATKFTIDRADRPLQCINVSQIAP